jgi:hypothetical protein
VPTQRFSSLAEKMARRAMSSIAFPLSSFLRHLLFKSFSLKRKNNSFSPTEGDLQERIRMKIKLAAFLAFVLLVMAGCTAANTNTGNTGNTGNTSNSANANRAATTPANNNENMVKANADPTSTTGGTKEGCKCSAAGMACNSKDGKGCCGAEGCSTMKDGKSECCSKQGKEGDACCSTAGKTASAGKEGTEKKEPAKKS